MEQKLDIIAIGESLIELSTDLKLSCAECLHKYYGGDALAVAIAALRAGSRVGFITKVGDDAFKDYLLDSWNSEGLDISQVKLTEEQNGLYFIARPTIHEKEFAYYRKKIAPSKLSIDDISEDYIKSAKMIYTSGVTQTLSMCAREAVSAAFKIAKQNGIQTAYDPNYSLRTSTPEEAREYFNNIIEDVDILFMSAKYDTVNILELDSAENIIKKLWDMGVSIVVIKASKKCGYFVGANGSIKFIEFFAKNVIDTTCSGDAFNGGFLHAITHGYSPVEAAKIGSIVAGLQCGKIGAIKSIPYSEDIFKIYNGGCGV